VSGTTTTTTPAAPEYGGFSIVQNGMCVASGSGPLEAIRAEAAHYAAMYRQDGPVKMRVWKNSRKAKTV
jgi:hypothetical protein